jgi:hypothetical protein
VVAKGVEIRYLSDFGFNAGGSQVTWLMNQKN